MKNTLTIAADIMIGIVALEHLYILWMEMFSWEKKGKEAFRGALPDELFKPTKGLAANQGLYNGFLSAGLIWSFLIADKVWQNNVALFFLSCVFVAGIFGGLMASKKIIVIQAMPSLIALILVLLRS